VPPIRQRKTVSDSWIELSIAEGRNRQIRRMTAAVGLPTLRLVRAQIGKLRINDLALGQTLVLSGNNATEIFNKYLKG
jgi:23S rRNA pseudouridine2457 synthase